MRTVIPRGLITADKGAPLTLYLLARTLSEGSMIPPRSRRTRWRVDSFWMSAGQRMFGTTVLPSSVAEQCASASSVAILFFLRIPARWPLRSYPCVRIRHACQRLQPITPEIVFASSLLLCAGPSHHAHCLRNRQIEPLQLTVVRKGSSVLKLLSGEDQSLLVRRDTLLVLDLRLDVVDGVGGLDLEGDGLAREARRQHVSTNPSRIPSTNVLTYTLAMSQGVRSSVVAHEDLHFLRVSTGHGRIGLVYSLPVVEKADNKDTSDKDDDLELCVAPRVSECASE